MVNVDEQSTDYLTVEQAISVGDWPVDVVVLRGQQGFRAYVSCSDDGSVTVLGL